MLILLVICLIFTYTHTNKNNDIPISTNNALKNTEIPEFLDLDSIGEENTSLEVSKNHPKNDNYVVEYSFSKHITIALEEETTKYISSPKKTSTEKTEDNNWISKAIQDIGHYLRSHRFKEYDRRYNLVPPKILGEYFLAYPKPPLRSLHWEVNKYCDDSFIQCIRYLGGKVRHVGLRKEDDTVYIIKEMNWTLTENNADIMNLDSDCRNFSTYDFYNAIPFEGPLERYQWRTTASYFMCWYTMKEEPALKYFNESCDNFADCLSPEFGVSNEDPRANDENPFACSLYSFCPDTCCPIRHINDTSECLTSKLNPCLLENEADPNNLHCILHRNENQDFRDIVLNRFNVTCHCRKEGHVWESRYGICVDIDECVSSKHDCDKEKEVCVNTLGKFKCACNWGYVWSDISGNCEPSDALNILKREREYKKKIRQKPEVTLSIFKMIANLFKRSSSKMLENNKMLIVFLTLNIESILKLMW